VFNPPLSQHDYKPIPGPSILVATIIALIVLVTFSGLFAPVANQTPRHADGTLEIPIGP
jgi:hypothetical protein